jgi:hypothetical protein
MAIMAALGLAAFSALALVATLALWLFGGCPRTLRPRGKGKLDDE